MSGASPRAICRTEKTLGYKTSQLCHHRFTPHGTQSKRDIAMRPATQYCVEFRARDGVCLPNTCNLIKIKNGQGDVGASAWLVVPPIR